MVKVLELISDELGISIALLIILALWTIAWKGFALWKSARRNEPVWFVALLMINTLGILEILYIFVFSENFRTKKRKNSRKERKKR